MKSNLISILIGAALAYGGLMLLSSTRNLVSQEVYDKNERLCSNSQKVMGMLKDSVMQSTTEIGSSEMIDYEIYYAYTVNGKVYQAAKTIKDLETEAEPIADVWYETANPASNTLKDPCTVFENFKKTKKIGSSTWRNILGAVIGLIGISLAWGSLKGLVVGLFRGGKGKQA